MWQFIKGWWDIRTAIAVVALIQPWVLWLYRKYGKGGHIDVHPTGNVEIGFSALGATVGLQGTLRAVDREFFVSSMALEVVREADQSRHTLEWGAFRPPAVLVGETKDPIEMPAGFMLQPLAPRRYNIVFVDMATQAAVRQLTDPLQAAWFTALTANDLAPDGRQQYYEAEFNRTALHVNTFADLDPIIYWHPGDYRIQLRIHTTRPDRNFSETRRFTLTGADIAGLRGNRIPMLLQVVGLPSRLHFAYSTYR